MLQDNNNYCASFVAPNPLLKCHHTPYGPALQRATTAEGSVLPRPFFPLATVKKSYSKTSIGSTPTNLNKSLSLVIIIAMFNKDSAPVDWFNIDHIPHLDRGTTPTVTPMSQPG
ncbi:hypothetical protein GEMRC1_000555 [Eukaryota sp. GEM-RC1]